MTFLSTEPRSRLVRHAPSPRLPLRLHRPCAPCCAVGDFVDEGSAYSFEVGTPGAGGVPATLTVIPPPDRRTPMRTSLVVGDREVPQSESLGTAEADREAGEGPILPVGVAAAAAGGGGAASSGGSSGAPSLVRQGSFKIKS